MVCRLKKNPVIFGFQTDTGRFGTRRFHSLDSGDKTLKLFDINISNAVSRLDLPTEIEEEIHENNKRISFIDSSTSGSDTSAFRAPYRAPTLFAMCPTDQATLLDRKSSFRSNEDHVSFGSFKASFVSSVADSSSDDVGSGSKEQPSNKIREIRSSTPVREIGDSVLSASLSMSDEYVDEEDDRSTISPDEDEDSSFTSASAILSPAQSPGSVFEPNEVESTVKFLLLLIV